MEEHDLTQVDLPEVGSQRVVSEILAGKHALNIRPMRVLGKRFGGLRAYSCRRVYDDVGTAIPVGAARSPG